MVEQGFLILAVKLVLGMKLVHIVDSGCKNAAVKLKLLLRAMLLSDLDEGAAHVVCLLKDHAVLTSVPGEHYHAANALTTTTFTLAFEALNPALFTKRSLAIPASLKAFIAAPIVAQALPNGTTFAATTCTLPASLLIASGAHHLGHVV